MIRRPPRSTRVRSSAASDVYKRQRFDIAADARVLAAARRPQGYEIVVQGRIKARRQFALAGKAPHPDAVADQQVIERAVHRLEEGAAVGAIVGVGQLGGGGIEPLVAPGVIAGEHLVTGLHGSLLWCAKS